MTPGGEIESVVSACYESNHPRRLSEEYLLHLFAPLPYSLAPAIASDNEQRFFARYNVATENAAHSRMFPSGSLDVNLTKPLHDDKNGVISPGLWQCIQADPHNRVNVIFSIISCSWSFESTQHRFAWFNGLVPHKSELRRPPAVESSTARVHHSSYIKLEHEQLALVPLSKNMVDQLRMYEAPMIGQVFEK